MIRPEHSNFTFFQDRKIIKFEDNFRTSKPYFQAKILTHSSVTKVLQKYSGCQKQVVFKCGILFTFHSNCSIEAEVKQAHMGRGVHSLKHLMCLCTLDKVIQSVKFLFLASRFWCRLGHSTASSPLLVYYRPLRFS